LHSLSNSYSTGYTDAEGHGYSQGNSHTSANADA
jgi:hypothetical protein